MASTYLQKTGISSGNRRTWTFSAWVKRSNIGEQRIFNQEQSSGTSQISVFKWDGSNKILYADSVGSGNSININSSNMVFKDVNAWYHLVLRVDTTDATADNRARIYVNGQDIYSELGGYSTYTQPSQNYDTFANQSGNKITIGAWVNNTTQYFDGCMSHIHYCDGYSYAPTEFGETDSTTGEWKIKTSPSVSYGTNGFFILKDGNSVTDQSGNGNNFTVASGTLTKTEDCPSNVFATWNPLIKTVASFSNGNLSCTTASGEFGSASSLGVSQGKYYAEFKITASSLLVLGVADENGVDYSSNNNISSGKTGATGSIGFPVFSGVYRINNSNTSYGNSFSQNDIVSIAIDYANQKIYLGKNGTWQNSANPVSGTGGIDVSSVLTGNDWFFTIGDDTNTSGSSADANFGNGYFGTTAVSSAGTNASGNGIFEYDVPTGYTALSTKGLNE